MKNFATILAITFFGGWTNLPGQTATIQVLRQFYDNSYEEFDAIRFIINGTVITAMDTVKRSIRLQAPFDQCQAIIGRDTIRFLTKFKPGEAYIIQPGCCCAAFTLQPKNKPRKGTVIFKNNTARDLALVVATANIDTVKRSHTQTTFAYESAMCLFKPCSILVTETAYCADTYDSRSDDRDYAALRKEQATYILATTRFHFLHGEKIKIRFNEKTGKIDLELAGYLTNKEYKDWYGW